MIYADFQEMKTDRLRLRRLRRMDAQAFFHFAGSIDLLGFKENDSTCSFAYMLAEEFRGRGFGTEAMTAVLNFAFQNMQVSAVGGSFCGECRFRCCDAESWHEVLRHSAGKI